MTVWGPEVEAKLRAWDGVYKNVDQARWLGVTDTSICRWRTRIGLNKPRQTSPDITPELEARVLAFAAEGMSRKGISEATGISQWTLARRFPEAKMDLKEAASLGSAVRNFNREFNAKATSWKLS